MWFSGDRDREEIRAWGTFGQREPCSSLTSYSQHYLDDNEPRQIEAWKTFGNNSKASTQVLRDSSGSPSREIASWKGFTQQAKRRGTEQDPTPRLRERDTTKRTFLSSSPPSVHDEDERWSQGRQGQNSRWIPRNTPRRSRSRSRPPSEPSNQEGEVSSISIKTKLKVPVESSSQPQDNFTSVPLPFPFAQPPEDLKNSATPSLVALTEQEPVRRKEELRVEKETTEENQECLKDDKEPFLSKESSQWLPSSSEDLSDSSSPSSFLDDDSEESPSSSFSSLPENESLSLPTLNLDGEVKSTSSRKPSKLLRLRNTLLRRKTSNV